MISSRARASAPLALILFAALALIPSRAIAAGASHTTLADFQANIRGDFLLSTLSGAANLNLPPIVVSGNGYACTIAAGNGVMSRDSRGAGAVTDIPSTVFTMTGRPVTAFAGTFVIVNQADASVAGTINVTTNTGENFTFSTAAAGTFFGFTTTLPFTTVSVNCVPASGFYELIDGAYFGTSATVAVAADQCADASTVGVGAYPFTTVGATRNLNNSSCGTETTSPDVYFRFMPTATGLATVDTCGCTFDSILRIFGSCGGTEIACNDDFCSTSSGFDRASRVQFRVVAGQPVIIRIAGHLNASGSGTLTVAEHADCAADFNHSGGTEVQDIFDFLAAWFGGCP